MKIAILQSNYAPWKGYFDLIDFVDIFVIYDCVQYTKNDWRNRNQIIVAGEPRWLTVPVRQKKLNQSIEDTEVASTFWARTHWRTIEQSYSKSSGYEFHHDALKELYIDLGELKMLSEINSRLINYVQKVLKINTSIVTASTQELPEDRIDRLITICKKYGATEYVSGPSASYYLAPSDFLDTGVKLNWFNYKEYREYPQRTSSFIHEVSILDLMLNTGDEAHRFFRGKR